MRTGSPEEEAFPHHSYYGSSGSFRMWVGKLPGIVSESEARGLVTRSNGALLGEGELESVS